MVIQDALQEAEHLAVHGCSAAFIGRSPLKMKIDENQASCRPRFEQSGIDLYSASQR
jgi:hypothetical protein